MSFIDDIGGLLSEGILFAYDQMYQKSPIFLKKGIAEKLISQLPTTGTISADNVNKVIGSRLPIAALLLPMAGSAGTDGWAFRPEPGAELYRSEINQYAFYDATTAANSTTKEPLRFDFTLTLPANGIFGMTLQMPTMEMLKASLDIHRNLGGLFDCVMPIGFYQDCILTDIKTTQIQVETSQLQPALLLSFVQPVVTKESAQNAYNNQIKRLFGSVGVAG